MTITGPRLLALMIAIFLVLVISAVIPFIHQPLPPPAPQPPIYVLIETPEGVVSFEKVTIP